MLNCEKSNFCSQEARFLGHVLSGEGLRPQPERLEVIEEFKQQKNAHNVEQFLGFINFYLKYKQHYATVPLALVKLLQEGKKFEWKQVQEEALRQ